MSNIEKTKDGLVEKSTGRKIGSPLDSISNSLIATLLNLTRSLLGHAMAPNLHDEKLKKKCNDLAGYILTNYTEVSFPKNGNSSMKK